jgi:hypothetical protein
VQATAPSEVFARPQLGKIFVIDSDELPAIKGALYHKRGTEEAAFCFWPPLR